MEPEAPTISPSPCACRGFTLLELLVVVAVMAVLAGLLVPGLTGTGGRDLERSAQRMAELINRARQEAALEARPWCITLRTEPAGYAVQRRAGGECREVADRIFREREIGAGLEWRAVTVNGEPVRDQGRALLFPTGEQDALEVVWGVREGDKRRRVRLGPVGRARVVDRD